MRNRLVRLELKNFRCFEDHAINFADQSLLVGKNNAGKSTCVEALRIVSIVTERMKNLPLKTPPKDLDLASGHKGFGPSLESIAIHREGLFFRYSDPPAIIVARFSNNSSVKIFLLSDLKVHALVYDQSGKLAKTKPAVLASGILVVSILPQIGPLSEQERKLGDDYVRKNVQSTLSSIHFRNQLRIFKDQHWVSFKEMVSRTWKGLEVRSLELPEILDPGGRISLLVRDGDFSAEIASMGHGLQMWLQTMWFLCRSSTASVLILDEPDVYMHADLQRKLIQMLLRMEVQFIIATHSPEMMAEVSPDSIIVLDRSRAESKPATSSRAVQAILNEVGSVQNISLARLATYKKVLMVEGEDVALLRKFQNAAGPIGDCAIDTVPNSNFGGWSKWPSVVVLANFLRRNADDRMEIHCLLDRDFRTEEELQHACKEAEASGIRLHIWKRKELENYLLSPKTIGRLLSEAGVSVPDHSIQELIDRLAEEMRNETIDLYSESIRVRERKGANYSNPKAREIVSERWKSLGGKSVVSGKKLFSRVADQLQKNHGLCVSHHSVVSAMRADEVPSEIIEVLNSITTFPDRMRSQ